MSRLNAPRRVPLVLRLWNSSFSTERTFLAALTLKPLPFRAASRACFLPDQAPA